MAHAADAHLALEVAVNSTEDLACLLVFKGRLHQQQIYKAATAAAAGVWRHVAAAHKLHTCIPPLLPSGVRVAGVQLPSAWSGARRHPIHWLHLLIADPMLKTWLITIQT